MERISTAQAMEWSVELERGLRSNKPGKLIEAILQTGPRIEQWSKEHRYPTEVLKMFGLVPGEDRLFANTILLRLADAFRKGDRHTRLCVLKVFLIELRQRRKKGKRYNGILAKQRVSNALELLKRVKIVFDAGDVESKALALRLLGCWADIAKDSAEIRYMILSKLDSNNVLEAKASLFAAGCISELSEDFASVVLEIMINMIKSQQTSSFIKLAGARTFSRMGYSSILASRAYKVWSLMIERISKHLHKKKMETCSVHSDTDMMSESTPWKYLEQTGKKLIVESSHEEFKVEMLMSLTKLASKSILLISEQVDLLLQFISQKSAPCVQAMALRCFYSLLAGGVYRFPVNASVVTTLIHVLDDINLPLDSQCKSLQMLRKLFESFLPNFPRMDFPEFAKLVQSVEVAAQSPITSKRFLALQLLVDISRNHRMAMEMIPRENDPTPFPNRVFCLVIDLIVGLVKPVFRPCGTASELKKECRSLLNLLIILVEEYPTLAVLALDKIRMPVEYLVDKCIGNLNSRILDSSVHEILGFNGEKHASKLVFCMYRFVESCIERADEASGITAQVHQLLKILVNVIRQSSLFNHDICTIFLFVLHTRCIWAYMRKENNGTCSVAKNLGISPDDNWVEHEKLTLEYTKKMMSGRDHWAGYRAGKQAACQGAWFAVAYMFCQLTKRVQSNNCSYWLKSLSLFARAESTILILTLPKEVSEIWIASCGSVLGEVGDGVTWNAYSRNSIEKLSEAYSGVRSAAEMLASAITLDQTFYFQRWFLALRAKVLEAVVDILKILSSDPCKTQNIGNCRCFEGSAEVGILGPAQHVHLLALFLTRMSFRLNRLVQEFDLLATSFMGIDSRSFRSISRLALNCSLLAFSTGFVIYYPHLQFYEKSMLSGLENLEKCSHITLLKDVTKRLWHIDDETSKNLKALLALIEDPKICCNLHPRTLISRVGHRERETLAVCRFAVLGILHIHEETKKLKDEGVPCPVSRTGVQLLSNILKMWMGISFQTPNYFFQVRPCVGAELFAFSADTRTSDEISIFPGFHLSLSLCLQLRNAPTVLPARITKLYCILSCRPTDQTAQLRGESKERMQSDSQVWETDDALDLNDKLMLYVTEGMKRTGRKHGRTGDDSGFVWSCVCLEPNERGQGFSTCLLDVSTFPLGSYRIKWHSCCIDSQGSYWSLLPLNTGPLFTVKKPIVTL